MRHLELWLAAVALVSCHGCSPSVGPCVEDRFECVDNSTGFAIDASCELEGALEVTLGQGRDGFEALGAGQLPDVLQGAQGGIHAFVALQVENAALDRYDTLLVEVVFEYLTEPGAISCTRVGEGQAARVPQQCMVGFGDRAVVLGHHHPIRLNESGQVEEFGMLVFLDPGGNIEQATITMTVTDPCGRVGVAKHHTGALAL